MSEPAPLQQINRTCVRFRGRVLTYFAGCDYFRLSQHPAILRAVQSGLKKHGLNVAASRVTTGNHRLYLETEARLAKFFGAPSAVLLPSGYVTSAAVAQSLKGEFSHVILDERSHMALMDASSFLESRKLTFAHRDVGSLEQAVRRCGRNAGIILLTDGLFARDGAVAPLAEYLRVLPGNSLIVVDDAHGCGVLGERGRGSLEFCNVNRSRVVQCVTFSKAFGVYGGAVLCSRAARERIMARSGYFPGTTPLPLPLVCGISAALELMQADRAMRQRLFRNAEFVRTGLRHSGVVIQDQPGPVIALPVLDTEITARVRRELLRSGVFPSFLKYPGGPATGFFRFVISSEHTQEQLVALVDSIASGLKPR
jgi:7-keto-8-aminopelargonate synthetase-like enzyme